MGAGRNGLPFYADSRRCRGRGDAFPKDDDFNARSVLFGASPKVLHLRVGKVPTSAVVDFVLDRRSRIPAFGEDPETSPATLLLISTGNVDTGALERLLFASLADIVTTFATPVRGGRGRRRRRRTRPWRSRTACTVLIAGHATSGHRFRSRSRSFGASQLGYPFSRRTISFSTAIGNWLAWRCGRRLRSVSPISPASL